MAVKMTFAPESRKLTKEERWVYANFTNAYIFGTILKDNPDITKRIIELAVPDLPIDEIMDIDREERQETAALSKTTFLDVKVKLKNGKIVMIEMQVIKRDYFLRRLRYYRSQADVMALKDGDAYGELPDVIQIAICCFDPLGEGYYAYDCELYDKKSGKIMSENGQRIILLNAKGYNGKISEELKEFLSYIDGKESEGKLSEQIDDRVRKLKYDEARKAEYMLLKDWEDDIRFEERQEALKEGLELGMRLMHAALIRNGINEEEALKQVSESYQKPVQEVEAVIRVAENCEVHESL